MEKRRVDMGFYDECARKACDRLSRLLLLPPIPGDDGFFGDGEHFDPWDLFPCVYGSYSSAFDDMAITVLSNIRDGKFEKEELAAEMFREMLCTTGLCDYGTSPRGCFASSEFAPLLPTLIERWKEYARLRWGEGWQN